MRRLLLGCLAVTLFALASCDSTSATFDTYDFQPERLAELVPLQTGKYIIYKVDSTVFTNSGLVQEIHAYQEKNVVDVQITDNAGQPAYRVYKYQRDAAGTGAWQSTGTYFVSVLPDRVEWVENNRRVTKLILPVREGTTWKGNMYIPDEPFSPFINNFSISNALKTWEFTYSSSAAEKIGDATVNDVRTVYQDDEGTNLNANDRPENENAYAAKSFSLEKYAKNIGLVYQELMLWEYQPEPANSTASYKGTFKGFGVKRTMIEHN